MYFQWVNIFIFSFSIINYVNCCGPLAPVEPDSAEEGGTDAYEEPYVVKRFRVPVRPLSNIKSDANRNCQLILHEFSL